MDANNKFDHWLYCIGCYNLSSNTAKIIQLKSI